MLFNSLDFVIFLAVVLLAVRVAALRWRTWILLLAGAVFYGWWDWRYLGLLGFNCLTAFTGGIRIADARTEREKRFWCGLSVVVCASLLGYFKYRGFFLENLTALLTGLGLMSAARTIEFVLPVGVSFYTFQAIAYLVDVYRGVAPACRNLRDFLLFQTFFPQLVAGPIERTNHLLPQLQQWRRVTPADIVEGLYLVLWGYCKKVVVADNLGLKVNRIFAQDQWTAGDVVLAGVGFTFQAYADFSGYTDIARGVARWFGVTLFENFNFPYYATSPQDFWRRWHMSLGSWLRDYLYIPLGGSRRGPVRTCLNLVITMLVGGLWHGAAWTYVVWGFYQGTILSLHRLYVAWRGERRHSHLSRVACIAGNFLLTAYGMFLFRSQSWEQTCKGTAALFGLELEPQFWGQLLKMLPYCGLVLLVETPIFLTKNPWFYVRRHPLWVAAFFLFLFYLILIMGVTGGDQFIYFAF
ncbi:MAG: MBOAT family protein [Verrucomicrobiae bacterium]|nr:MBOAT family protein [Verrucomicrobiae bacterium]MDW8307768.1 MBOAT family O-acyltransferase [Verrucomicrobiales bacterium]